MALDVEALAQSMFAAAKGPLEADWKTAEPFVQTELKKIAQQIVEIEAQLATGAISKEKAVILIDMQKKASQEVLLTVEGISLLAVQNAINAALGVIRGTVNGALKFPLL